MRRLLSYFSFAAMLFACGEAGVGVNLSKELPVTIPFDVEVPTVPSALEDLLNVNPPSESLSYSLDGVDAFADDLDNIGEVTINSISYEISDIDAQEAGVELDEFSVTIQFGTVPVQVVSQVDQNLSNSGKQLIDLTAAELEELQTQLFGGSPISAEVIFDLKSIPPDVSNLSISYTMYFDVTIGVDLSDVAN